MPIPLVTRILIADDHAIVRSGLKGVLDAKPDMEVVAEAEDGAEAVEKALKEDVHLAILDVSMPRMTGIQAAAELQKRKPELKIGSKAYAVVRYAHHRIAYTVHDLMS